MAPPTLVPRWRALVLALLLVGLLAGPGALAAAAAPGSAPPAGGLPRLQAQSLQAKMEVLQAKLNAQNTRLEVLAEDLDDAYSSGAKLLAASAAMDQRRQLATAGVLAARAEPEALPQLQADKARIDRLAAMMVQKVTQQARKAERMHRERAEATALATTMHHELAAMDQQLAAMLASDQQRQEAERRAAFSQYLDLARAKAGGKLAATGPASPIARRVVQVALAQLGVPYVYGAAGPDNFDCSGLTSFAYHAAGRTIPRTAAWQFAAFAADHFVAPTALRAGDLVFYATDPANPATIHHVGMYIGNGLMVEAPHTGTVVRVATIWRPDYAGAVRPAP